MAFSKSKIPLRLEKRIEQYFPVTVFLLKCNGIFNFGRGNNLIYEIFSWLIYCYLIIATAFMGICKICYLYFVNTEDEDIVTLAINLYDCFTAIVVMVQMIWMLYNKNILVDLMDYANECFVFYSARGLTNTTMTNCYRIKKYLSISLLTVGSMILHQGSVSILVHNFFMKNERKLPMQVWYPFDAQVSPFYEVAFIHQFTFQSIITISYCSLLFFYGSCCFLICGQMDLLCCSLANVRFTAILKCGVTYRQLNQYFSKHVNKHFNDVFYFCGSPSMEDSEHDYNVAVGEDILDAEKAGIIDIYSTEYDDETEKAIKECIFLHERTTLYFDKFHRLISPMLMFKMIAITIHQCIMLYCFSVSGNSFILEMYLLSCTDCFILSYFGNQIMLQNFKISDAIYQSHWWACNKRCTQLMSAYIITCNRQYVITGGNFFKMTLQNFITVLKTGYSFFAFSRNVNK